MSIILGVAPFLALFTVPTLGKMSDSCGSRYGRRRPFIFAFSIILVLSLLLLYIGQSLTTEEDTKRLRMLLLAVGVILLDYASQAAINPCEALMSDLMAGMAGPEATGFTVYSGMLSVGACIGYLLTALDWSALGLSHLGTREQISIVMVLILYGACLLVTLLSARERRYRVLAPGRGDPEMAHTSKLSNLETTSDPGYESDETSPGELGPHTDPHWSLPRVTGTRIILMMRRWRPGKLLSSVPRMVLNVKIFKVKYVTCIFTRILDFVLAPGFLPDHLRGTVHSSDSVLDGPGQLGGHHGPRDVLH